MGSFFAPRSEVDRTALARMFEEAVNARDFDALALLVTHDLTVLDSLSAPVEGRSTFIAATRKVFEKIPNLSVSYDEISVSEDGLLIRGHLHDRTRGASLASLWQMQFEGPLISQIQAFRESNAVSLATFARQVGPEA